MLIRRQTLVYFLIFLPICIYAAGISYRVEYEGVDNSSLLKSIKSVSELTSLKDNLPASINALRFRAESDIPEILKVLHAYGYYEAKIQVKIEENLGQIKVIVCIEKGALYTIESYSIFLFCKTPEDPIRCPKLDLAAIGIKLGKPMLAKKILDAELKALQLLSISGYPLASISHREIIADGETKGIRIRLDIDTGPLAHFGAASIQGIHRVRPELICKKMIWKEGEEYDSDLVENTQKALMDTGLFSSVIISHEDALAADDRLPMRIEVTETKHRSVNIGASYQTFYGPGITFGWEHRNIGGIGRRLSFKGDVTRRSHTGLATYLIPDFRRIGQDLVFQAEATHESITPYSERSYSGTGRIERKIGKHIRVAASAVVDRLYVTDSAQNGNYVLLEIPLYFRWSNANNLLDPSRGMTFEYKIKPTLTLTQISDYYMVQQASQCFYWALTKNNGVVFAQKFTVGSILSQSQSDVPLSKRFFGGSEDDLRGYRYLTVSPLAHHHKPLGGRSAIFYTAEMRLRVTQSMGLVPFFDLGEVGKSILPSFTEKWFKSVGLGYRYFSFLGPLRLDVAFPLNRRKNLDPVYRVLVNIGQTF